MRPTRPPLQSQIKNERVAIASDSSAVALAKADVLSGFLIGEGYALRRRTLQQEQEQEEEEEEEEE
jgi:hypothetical protein